MQRIQVNFRGNMGLGRSSIYIRRIPLRVWVGLYCRCKNVQLFDVIKDIVYVTEREWFSVICLNVFKTVYRSLYRLCRFKKTI